MRTKIPSKLGKPGEPVAEKSEFGLTIVSSSENFGISNKSFATSTDNCNNLCKLVVLGLETIRMALVNQFIIGSIYHPKMV